MFKKIGILTVAAAAALALVSWAGLGSYTATAWSNIKKTFKKQVPLEFEIQRVRHEVEQLVPDMKQNFKAVAEEIVAIENLKDEIRVTKDNLRAQKENILTMTHDLDSGTEPIVYDGREYSRARVRDKLERDFASCKNCEAELKSKQKLLEAREKALDAARERLASVRRQKQELEVQIAQLEAQLKAVRLAQSRSKFHLDDSRLSQCKATLAEIRNRLKVEMRQTELEGQFANDAIPVERKAMPVGELTREVKAYLGETSRVDGKVAAERK